MTTFTVVLDACVLYPAPLRDLLIELAAADLFRAKWTDAIHDEWMRKVLADRPDLTAAQLDRTRDLMNHAVLDCMVAGYEHLIPAVELPDADDRHVVAAAIHAHADAIVTSNLKDFPAEELAKHRIDSIHPDDFIRFQFDLNEAGVVAAARACRKRLLRPPLSSAEYLQKLRRLSLPKTVDALLRFSDVI